MKDNTQDTITTHEAWHTLLNKVTPISRALALVLFVALPFVGFWIGMKYAETNEVDMMPVGAPNDIDTVAVVESEISPAVETIYTKYRHPYAPFFTFEYRNDQLSLIPTDAEENCALLKDFEGVVDITICLVTEAESKIPYGMANSEELVELRDVNGLVHYVRIVINQQTNSTPFVLSYG